MFRLAIVKPISFAVFRELIHSTLLILILSLFIFLLLFMSPGDYVMQEYLLLLMENQGIENPIPEKLSFLDSYFLWFMSFITGNFGISSSNGMPVMDQILGYTFNTLLIIVSALVISLLVALPIALLTTNNKLKILSQPTNVLLHLLSVLPLFWLSYIAIYYSGKWFNFFPLASDFDDLTLSQFILPVLLLSLGSGVLIEVIQLISSELRRVLNEEYVLYARAKGASMMRHATKEGIIFPVLTLFSNRLAYLFGASIIVEQIFNWPGLGRIIWRSAQDRDVALLLSAVLVSATLIRFTHFITRLMYILLNPRASHQ